VNEDTCVKVWVHSCEFRAGSECLTRTLLSLRESDIGNDFEVCMGPPWTPQVLTDPEAKLYMDPWWKDTLMRKSEESTAGGKRGYVLRLEDDVIVNRHILHNVKTWPALDEPQFGMGDLFNYDGMWPDFLDLTRLRPVRDGVLRRLELDQIGAQGQLFASAALPKVFNKVPRAFEMWSSCGCAYDHIVSRACNYAGFGYYAHLPSLVNCHDGCKLGSKGQLHEGHFSHKTFSLDWMRGAP